MNNRKAPASPPHHKSGRSRSGRAPGQSEGEKGQQETVRIEEGELHFNGYTNPQGWLPPCYLSVVVAGLAIHGHPQTARSIEKRLPAPTPQEQAESDQNGHPDRVKAKGAAGICSILTADKRG